MKDPASIDDRILEALAPFEGREVTAEIMEEMGNAVGKVLGGWACAACHRAESEGADLQRDCNSVRFCGECAKHHGSW
jgi:mono/diheme cytochrome c family protein